MIIDSQVIRTYLLTLQKMLCTEMQTYETQLFLNDSWQHVSGGGGKTSVLRQGRIFESVGVNFSHVLGDSLPDSATALRPELKNRRFEAMGVSSVIHPCNPYVPTAHLNVRFFVAFNENEAPIWWFGGGFDLTPYYPFLEDVLFWHKTALKACQNFGKEIYPRYKAWADRYFYLPHRKETRGVGGLFFDDLNSSTWGWNFSKCFDFVKSVGNHFWKAYQPLLQKRYQQPFGERERHFQLYRRGRYVEFNLIYDRGTLFGLQTGGRTESILMSLPPKVSWDYQWMPQPHTPEADLYAHYLSPQDWLEIS